MVRAGADGHRGADENMTQNGKQGESKNLATANAEAAVDAAGSSS